MVSKADKDRIVAILCAHCGESLSPDEVEIVPDLEIIDIFAARVGGRTEFVVRSRSGSVESVRFDAWPPQRGGTRTSPAGRSSAGRTREPVSERRSTMRIEELMSRDVHLCRPEDSLESAARLMWEHDCGCAPVCSGDGEQQVVGMITDRDITMCALFEGKPLSQLRVQDAMSRDVRSCRPDDDTTSVERLMSERQVRRVPVVNAQGALVGILSLADLALCAKPRSSRAAGRVTESEIRETLASICTPPSNVGASATGAASSAHEAVAGSGG